MKNKILINVYVSTIDMNYEIFIPTNETIKKVLELIFKSVQELSSDILIADGNAILMDPDTSKVYQYNSIVRDTNIVNGKKIILI